MGALVRRSGPPIAHSTTPPPVRARKGRRPSARSISSCRGEHRFLRRRCRASSLICDGNPPSRLTEIESVPTSTSIDALDQLGQPSSPRRTRSCRRRRRRRSRAARSPCTSRRLASHHHRLAVPTPPGRATRSTPLSARRCERGRARDRASPCTGSRNLPRGVTSTAHGARAEGPWRRRRTDPPPSRSERDAARQRRPRRCESDGAHRRARRRPTRLPPPRARAEGRRAIDARRLLTASVDDEQHSDRGRVRCPVRCVARRRRGATEVHLVRVVGVHLSAWLVPRRAGH